MSMLDKIRGKFFNKKSFNVGFNNRSPLSYITSTGPSVPSFSDPGLKSFEPGDWKGAYDSSDAVRAETQAEIAKGEGIAGAAYGAIKAVAGVATGGTMAQGFTDGGSAGTFDGIEKAFGGGKDNDQSKALQNFISQNPTASQSVIDAFKASLG